MATPSRRTGRPTMSDVAAHAGVSLKSVSRVVNREEHVSEALESRVRASIAELGFRPHTSARQLAAGAGTLIGYVQVDAANPFFAAVYRGLEDAVRGSGHLVIATSTDADPDREAAAIEALIEARVAGLVVAAAEGGDDLLREEIALGTAVVCVDRLLDGHADTVVADNRDATRAAVHHLREQGHARVAFLGGNPRVWTARERLAGFREATDGAGVSEEHVVLDVGDVDASDAATTHLLTSEPAPTAIVAGQDRIGIGALRALHRLGRQDDVALIVFDELPLADQLQPPVAVVAQDPTEMGRRAGTMLLERIAGHVEGPGRREVVPTRFLSRASGLIAPPAS